MKRQVLQRDICWASVGDIWSVIIHLNPASGHRNLIYILELK